jgi:hypothetical protein
VSTLAVANAKCATQNCGATLLDSARGNRSRFGLKWAPWHAGWNRFRIVGAVGTTSDLNRVVGSLQLDQNLAEEETQIPTVACGVFSGKAVELQPKGSRESSPSSTPGAVSVLVCYSSTLGATWDLEKTTRRMNCEERRRIPIARASMRPRRRFRFDCDRASAAGHRARCRRTDGKTLVCSTRSTTQKTSAQQARVRQDAV